MERYTYVSTISAGAYGVVYQCVDMETGRFVAAKGIRLAHQDAEVMRLTLREVKILKTLPSHPNVVKLLEAFRSKSGRVYLVFEFVERSLYEELDRHPSGALPCPMVKSVAWQLLHALAHCHDHKVLHRDLKPANVLLSGYTPGLGGGGVAKLCDFGFARIVGSSHTCGRTGDGNGGAAATGRTPGQIRTNRTSSAPMSSYVMTRWYRPPEVLVGDSYGTPIDIWSFGCTLAELATGRPIFPGQSTADQLWKIMRCLGPLPRNHMTRILLAGGNLAPLAKSPPTRSKSLRQRLPEVSPELLDLISVCLTLDPRQRPTARELLQMPYFWDIPRLLSGSDLARQLPYAADLVCTTNGAAVARRQPSGLAGGSGASAYTRNGSSVGGNKGGDGQGVRGGDAVATEKSRVNILGQAAAAAPAAAAAASGSREKHKDTAAPTVVMAPAPAPAMAAPAYCQKSSTGQDMISCATKESQPGNCNMSALVMAAAVSAATVVAVEADSTTGARTTTGVEAAFMVAATPALKSAPSSTALSLADMLTSVPVAAACTGLLSEPTSLPPSSLLSPPSPPQPQPRPPFTTDEAPVVEPSPLPSSSLPLPPTLPPPLRLAGAAAAAAPNVIVLGALVRNHSNNYAPGPAATLIPDGAASVPAATNVACHEDMNVESTLNPATISVADVPAVNRDRSAVAECGGFLTESTTWSTELPYTNASAWNPPNAGSNGGRTSSPYTSSVRNDTEAAGMPAIVRMRQHVHERCGGDVDGGDSSGGGNKVAVYASTLTSPVSNSSREGLAASQRTANAVPIRPRLARPLPLPAGQPLISPSSEGDSCGVQMLQQFYGSSVNTGGNLPTSSGLCCGADMASFLRDTPTSPPYDMPYVLSPTGAPKIPTPSSTAGIAMPHIRRPGPPFQGSRPGYERQATGSSGWVSGARSTWALSTAATVVLSPYHSSPIQGVSCNATGDDGATTASGGIGLCGADTTDSTAIATACTANPVLSTTNRSLTIGLVGSEGGRSSHISRWFTRNSMESGTAALPRARTSGAAGSTATVSASADEGPMAPANRQGRYGEGTAPSRNCFGVYGGYGNNTASKRTQGQRTRSGPLVLGRITGGLTRALRLQQSPPKANMNKKLLQQEQHQREQQQAVRPQQLARSSPGFASAALLSGTTAAVPSPDRSSNGGGAVAAAAEAISGHSAADCSFGTGASSFATAVVPIGSCRRLYCNIAAAARSVTLAVALRIKESYCPDLTTVNARPLSVPEASSRLGGGSLVGVGVGVGVGGSGSDGGPRGSDGGTRGSGNRSIVRDPPARAMEAYTAQGGAATGPADASVQQQLQDGKHQRWSDSPTQRTHESVEQVNIHINAVSPLGLSTAEDGGSAASAATAAAPAAVNAAVAATTTAATASATAGMAAVADTVSSSPPALNKEDTAATCRVPAVAATPGSSFGGPRVTPVQPPYGFSAISNRSRSRSRFCSAQPVLAAAGADGGLNGSGSGSCISGAESSNRQKDAPECMAASSISGACLGSSMTRGSFLASAPMALDLTGSTAASAAVAMNVNNTSGSLPGSSLCIQAYPSSGASGAGTGIDSGRQGHSYGAMSHAAPVRTLSCVVPTRPLPAPLSIPILEAEGEDEAHCGRVSQPGHLAASAPVSKVANSLPGGRCSTNHRTSGRQSDVLGRNDPLSKTNRKKGGNVKGDGGGSVVHLSARAINPLATGSNKKSSTAEEYALPASSCAVQIKLDAGFSAATAADNGVVESAATEVSTFSKAHDDGGSGKGFLSAFCPCFSR